MTVTCLPKMEIWSAMTSLDVPSGAVISHFSIVPSSPMKSSEILPWMEPVFVMAFVPMTRMFSSSSVS